MDLTQQGLPTFLLVGLPNAAVKDERERVRTAIKNSGLVYPLRRITANLAPAALVHPVGSCGNQACHSGRIVGDR